MCYPFCETDSHCSKDLICNNGACVDPCEEITCGQANSCYRGVCYEVCDILSGDLFLFGNHRRPLSKTLYFDGTGYVILYKRRLKGTFPRLWDRPDADPTGIERSASELSLFLEGCKLLATTSLRSP